ncbi:hypothetical protein V2I01_37290 [Micromonospora sp. BRA006-A]|nr:hypothetical protein [Micromonospora sp. BRA006-A]
MREVDPHRRVPRTDALLADPALAAAAATLGRDRVKAAIVSAQARARRGELTPIRYATRRWPACPAVRPPGAQRHRRRAAHQPGTRPRPVRGGRAGRRRRAHRRGAGPADRPAGAARPGSAGRARRGGARRGGGARGEQRRGGAGAGRDRAGRRPGDRGEPWRAGRIGDGFRLPDLLASTGARLRGGHHQPHHARRLRSRDR